MASSLRTLSRYLPSKLYRQMVLFILVWTCLCYFIFRGTSNEVIHKSESSSNIRELLQTNINPHKEVKRSQVKAEERAEDDEEQQHEDDNNHEALIAGMESDFKAQMDSAEAIDILDSILAVDVTKRKDEGQLVKDLEKNLPNLPLIYLHENKDKKWHTKGNDSCGKFPSLYDLHINNVYWQETQTSNGTFYLYSAYLDKRENNDLGPTLRILGMINRVDPVVNTFCQIWYAGKEEPVTAKVIEYRHIWNKKWGNVNTPGILQPYLISCQLPCAHYKKVPISVSIVENECDSATNNLRVVDNSLKSEDEERKKFAVCVKGMNYPSEDVSVRLVEWFELIKVLGADMVFAYNLDVHPNITKVLDYYVKIGRLDLTPLTLPGFQPNMRLFQNLYLKNKANHKRQNELIPYNDCFYRNMYRYEYIAVMDVDELIMPLQKDNWADMMVDVLAESRKKENKTRGSFSFRNLFFIDEMLQANEPSGTFKDIPPYLHMLQHVYCTVNYTKPGHYIKSFHNPEKVLLVHNHYPLACLDGWCNDYAVPMELGRLQHYRTDCPPSLKNTCVKNVSVIADEIWRYKDEVVSRTTKVLSGLGFLRNK